jgi:hypothetical protein
MARKTLQTKSEAELAAYQVKQVGNTCSFHAIAVALRLLLDYEINPDELSDTVNKLWWRGRFMRVAPHWAVTPRMQVRIVRYLAGEKDLPITAFYSHGDIEFLPAMLSDPDSILLITLLWIWRQAPPIFLGDTTKNYNKTKKMGGHTMILASYDPQHQADGQFTTPWGFINPWLAKSKQLFWMRDEDFRKAWRFPLPLIGPNPLVVIQKTEKL